jgi:hypothetical protein
MLICLHHLFEVARAQGRSHIPAHAGQHHPTRVVQTFDDLEQRALNSNVYLARFLVSLIAFSSN